MEKTNKMEMAQKVKLNVNYIDFITKAMKQKISEKTTQALREMYMKNVQVKTYANIKRVNNRVQRPELKQLLSEELKKRKVNPAQFIKTCNILVTKISGRQKANNYINLNK